MELWGWIACLAAGQMIGIALCLLPQPAAATEDACRAVPAEDPFLGVAAMWSDVTGSEGTRRVGAASLDDRTAA